MEENSKSLIIFDWDDTILPTSNIVNFICSSHQNASQLTSSEFKNLLKYFSFDETQQQALNKSILHFLQSAQKIGKICIVTNSETGWVIQSSEFFLPELTEFIKTIPIVSAFDIYNAKTPKPENQQELYRWLIEAKKWAIFNLVEEHRQLGYLKYISVGDGVAEKYAMNELFGEKLCTGEWKHIQMSEHPTVQTLMAQQQIIADAFSTILHLTDNNLTIQYQQIYQDRDDDISKFYDIENVDNAENIEKLKQLELEIKQEWDKQFATSINFIQEN